VPHTEVFLFMNFLKKNLQQIPNTPGIYLFFDAKKTLMYVGKATSLRSRVQSYFRGVQTLRPIEQFVDQIADIKIKETDSVLEAIILEAEYIKKFLPKYNVMGRDSKSWNYLTITNEVFPRVVPIRQHEYSRLKTERLKDFAYVFGPYPGLNTQATMKLLRKLFMFSTCQKRGSKNGQRDPSTSLHSGRDDVKRPYPAERNAVNHCFYYQLGQCLGVCTGEISPAEYKKKVIQPLVTFLKGGKKRLIGTLKKRMETASKEKQFEEAGRLRDQVRALERIHDVALLNNSFFTRHEALNTRQSSNGSRATCLGSRVNVSRVEGYDISNLGSTGKVGSMVVFDAHGPVKSEYRKFKIKTVEGQSDVDCLEEIIRRRLTHLPDVRKYEQYEITKNTNEWAQADVFLIDGGKPQVNRVCKVLKEFGVEILVVGIAKGMERKKNEFVFAKQMARNKEQGTRDLNCHRQFVKWVNENRNLLIQVRDEAHRFAVAYQRKMRRI